MSSIIFIFFLFLNIFEIIFRNFSDFFRTKSWKVTALEYIIEVSHKGGGRIDETR